MNYSLHHYSHILLTDSKNNIVKSNIRGGIISPIWLEAADILQLVISAVCVMINWTSAIGTNLIAG